MPALYLAVAVHDVSSFSSVVSFLDNIVVIT